MRTYLFSAVLFCILFSCGLHADEVDAIVNSNSPPDAVVFEIAEAREGDLRYQIPKVLDAISRLRKKYPKMEFAVVSHGREEFALQSNLKSKYPKVHEDVISLVNTDVPVHVCETHASWYGVTAEDFPEYVNVAPTGQGQIQLYEEMGYQLIRIE